jgi:plasmid stability protein
VYTMFVRNVTISLPDNVLEALRDRAKNEHKSLNAWLRDLLSKEIQETSPWAEEFNRIADEITVKAPEWKWNREDTYAERIR